MNDLFSQFADQFKPKEEPKPEVKEEPKDRLVDRYEVYRKANPNERISVKEFLLLEKGESSVESLETMSEFDKKQRRLADKQKPLTDINKMELVIDSLDKHGKILIERMEPIKELTAADKFLAGRKEPKVFQSWDGEKVVESNEAPPPVTITITKDNYSGMPPGLKELQKLNGVNDHDLQKKALEYISRKNIVEGYIGIGSVFNSELEVEPLPEKEVQWEDFEEPITKEKKVRVFKKDFPTPERTQTVKQRSFVGIDNGVSGSVGIIYEDGTYEFFVTPVKKEQDYTKAKKLINRVQPLELADLFKYVGEGSMLMIERPMINSTRFNASMSAIRCFEATITILETLGLPYQVEDSKAWQKALLPIGITGDDLKKASKDVGNRLFPNTKLILHPDCDGMLIASYCKTQHR